MTMAVDRIECRLAQIEQRMPQLALVAKAFRRALDTLRKLDDDPYMNPDDNSYAAQQAIFEAAEILDDWLDEPWDPNAPVGVGEETGPECEICPSKPLLCVLAGAKRSEAVLGCVRCGWPLSPETYKAGLERYAALGKAIVPESWK